MNSIVTEKQHAELDNVQQQCFRCEIQHRSETETGKALTHIINLRTLIVVGINSWKVVIRESADFYSSNKLFI